MIAKKQPSVLLIIVAFAAVYLIWGSTYFFIEMAVKHISPMIIGSLRFIVSGVLMMIWVALKRESVWQKSAIAPAVISGVLMLFLGNGAVIWAEQFLPSSFVAIFLASAPLWFLLLDKINWQQNFNNKYTVAGVVVGLIGVVALFYEKVSTAGYASSVLPLIILCLANMSWALGSLFSKYKVKGTSASVNSAWQMLAAGLAFSITAWINGEFMEIRWSSVPFKAWASLAYLIVFGSIIGYSAYVFLLSVRSATQVSSYAYVNPLVAVLLGVFINHDRLTFLQLMGLVIILCSVFFINSAKRNQMKTSRGLEAES